MPAEHPLRAIREILNTALRDFRATSECRDFLFRVEEHRYTLPQVQALLEGAEVRVAAVAAMPTTLGDYASRFTDDPAMTDLAHWDEFEIEHPDAFAGMFLLWVEHVSARG